MGQPTRNDRQVFTREPVAYPLVQLPEHFPALSARMLAGLRQPQSGHASVTIIGSSFDQPGSFHALGQVGRRRWSDLQCLRNLANGGLVARRQQEKKPDLGCADSFPGSWSGLGPALESSLRLIQEKNKARRFDLLAHFAPCFVCKSSARPRGRPSACSICFSSQDPIRGHKLCADCLRKNPMCPMACMSAWRGAI